MASNEKDKDCPEQSPDSTVSYSSILDEHDINKHQRAARVGLLKELGEAKYNKDKKPNGVIVHISHGMLMGSDIPILGDVLLNIGDVETLNLIVRF